MAILRITIIDGKFNTTNGVGIKSQTEEKIFGNGWKVSSYQDGTIECISTSRYLDGRHCIKYNIYPDGGEKLSLWTPKEGKRVIKRGMALIDDKEQKRISGIIGLSGGKIDERYGYFRSFEFQKFLDEHNLSAVKFDQPNGLFRLVNRYNDAGYVLSDIYTDGKVTTVKIKWQQGNTEAGYYESIEMVSVSDATWTIVQKEKKSKWEVDYKSQ